MAGCGTRHGMDCSCGTNCKCKSGACVCGKKAKSSQSIIHQPNQLSNNTPTQSQIIGTNCINPSLQGTDSFNAQVFCQNNINPVPGNVLSLSDTSTPLHNFNQQQQGNFLSQEHVQQLLLHQQQHPNFNEGLNGMNMNMNGLLLNGNDLSQMLFVQQAQQQQPTVSNTTRNL